MAVSDAFRELGRFLEECESRGEVTDVGFVGEDAERALAVELSLSVPLSAAGGSAAEIGDDGSLRLTLESAEPVVPETDAATVAVTDTDVRDGVVTVALSATADLDDGGRERAPSTPAAESEPESVPAEPTDPIAAARDDDVPPFRNRALLAAVYDACDTFAEMAEELEMDVTAETVRRYMVDYDIHQPNSYDTGGSEEPAEPSVEEATATPVVLADGIGLPEDVTAETLIDTVRRSNTIYEVKQDIGLERDDALDVLRELNLLDLVVGRLATEADRDISREEIVRRLRDASAA